MFEVLKQESPSHRFKKLLNLTKYQAEGIAYRTGPGGLRALLRPRIEVAYYADENLAQRVAKEAVDQLKPKLEEKGQYRFDELENIADARDKFLAFLQRCWETYQKVPDGITPCVAIIQSSGSGKSQLLYQLAKETCRHDVGIRVLYTCTRVIKSWEFPATTYRLREWLFSQYDNFLTSHLKRIYYYALANWSTVGHEWIEVFTSANADITIEEKLSMIKELKIPASQPTKKVVVLGKSAKQFIGSSVQPRSC